MVVALRLQPSLLVSSPVADDSSTSSTVAVHRIQPKTPVLEVVKKTVQKKFVHFDETSNRYVNSALTKSQVRLTWYGAAEYKAFRALAWETAQHIFACEQRNRAPHSYRRVLERTYEACCRSSKHSDNRTPTDELVHLQRWMEVASSRIGLEKWAIRSISLDKTARRKALVQLVTASDGKSATQIAHLAAQVSRPSRLLGQCLAQANAAALRKERLFL